MTVLFVDTPPEVIQSRRRENALTAARERINDQVFEHHAARFQFPQDDEPLVRVTSNEDLERWIADAPARLSPDIAGFPG
jgi:thymidylate kinase